MTARVGSSNYHAWIVAIGLAAVFAAVRVVGTLGPVNLRWVMPVGFASMAILPYVLLDAAARREAGFRLPRELHVYGIALASGAVAALSCYALGVLMFGSGADNWFVSIASGYRRMMDTTGWDVTRLHLVFTLPALVFSPIGEECFFRGYLQYALERRFSERTSSITECAAFAVIHLCHHGLFLSAAGLGLRPLSGALWMLLMFGTAFMFARLRKRTGSLVPAIVSHAAFNLVMNLTIFGLLWPSIAQQ
jgi:membrane protease YdiL (CAAX protease family)